MDKFLTSQPAASKSATPATGAKRVRVPDDVSGMEHAELVGLVKKLCAERAAMETQLESQRSSGGSSSTAPYEPVNKSNKGKAPAAQSFLTPPPSAPKASEIAAMKKRLADKSVKAIKKTKHNDKRKPYTEVTEGMPNKATALALLEGLSPKSDTAKMTRWMLESDGPVAHWLGMEKLVHPVAFDGKVLCFAGERPQARGGPSTHRTPPLTLCAVLLSSSSLFFCAGVSSL
jgi:hypothetical protein